MLPIPNLTREWNDPISRSYISQYFLYRLNKLAFQNIVQVLIYFEITSAKQAISVTDLVTNSE